MLIMEKGHASIQKALKSSLGDLLKVVAAIKGKVEDQL